MATIKGTNGNDALVGLAEDDLIIGKAGDDAIVADIGNDTLIGGIGNDTLEGALGVDTASYFDAPGSIRADLTDGIAFGAAGEDVFITIENLTGSSFADVLIGDAEANKLIGGRGGDRLAGRGGNDALVGANGRDELSGGAGDDVLSDGRGRDVLTGGGGNDSFTFEHNGDIRGDRIVDLQAGDVIDLSQVDGDVTAAADQGFHLVDHFGGTSGELRVRYIEKHDWTVIQGDDDGDGRQDFTIRVDGNHEDFSNFVF
jgi:Ca2+-binding RTX toxin-like protein